MLDNPNGHPEEEAMEPEPLPLRTKGPPTSQDQQQQPPTSPPKATEDELDAALNGQEPTVKNLILAAIGVMKVSFAVELEGLKKAFKAFDHSFFFTLYLNRIARQDPIASASVIGSIEDMAVVSSKSMTIQKSKV